MARRKQPYNWNKVKPGDIISFRYKSSKKDSKPKTNSILVLNPKLPVDLKSGNSTFHLIGLKIEESNKQELFLNSRTIKLFEKIGQFKEIDEENNLYELDIMDRHIHNKVRGIKDSAYRLIAGSANIKKSYRTFDWKKARKSSVYLEPVRIYGGWKVIKDTEG